LHVATYDATAFWVKIFIMKLRVQYRGKELELEFEGDKVKAKDLLKAMNLSREYAFVVVNGEVVEEDFYIKEGDQVRVINAISGG
jgi:Sulfur transfer protein involved in thiamine biosynthesis